MPMVALEFERPSLEFWGYIPFEPGVSYGSQDASSFSTAWSFMITNLNNWRRNVFGYLTYLVTRCVQYVGTARIYELSFW